MHRVITLSTEETEALGRKLGQRLWAGSFIALTGDLGAGKTALTRGIARGLEITEHITSPTFTLIHEYQGRLPLYHFDVYRIGDADEMLDIGYEEYFDGEGITVVEWPQRIEELLPSSRLVISIHKMSGDQEREITLTPFGSQYHTLIEEIMRS